MLRIISDSFSGIDCGEINVCNETVDHATEYRNGTLFMDMISYECDTGYNNTSGDLNRTCLHNQTWSGEAPVCTSELFSQKLINFDVS